MPGFLEELAPAIPVVGSVGAAALQQKYALQNWNRVNEYNSWENQIARLRKAGLPLAALLGGSGGSQAGSIDAPNVDPTLGAAQGLQAYSQLRMQKKQLALMDQEIRIKTADADIAENKRDFELHRNIEGEIQDDTLPQLGDTNLVLGLRRERALKKTEAATAEVINQLKNIELKSAPDKIKAEIDHILTQVGIGNLQIQRDSNYYKMLEQISEDFIKGGTGWEGLARLVKAWFYKLALR